MFDCGHRNMRLVNKVANNIKFKDRGQQCVKEPTAEPLALNLGFIKSLFC